MCPLCLAKVAYLVTKAKRMPSSSVGPAHSVRLEPQQYPCLHPRAHLTPLVLILHNVIVPLRFVTQSSLRHPLQMLLPAMT